MESQHQRPAIWGTAYPLGTLDLGEGRRAIDLDAGAKHLDLVRVHRCPTAAGVGIVRVLAVLVLGEARPPQQTAGAGQAHRDIRVLAIRMRAFVTRVGWFSPNFLSSTNPARRRGRMSTERVGRADVSGRVVADRRGEKGRGGLGRTAYQNPGTSPRGGRPAS